MENGFTCAGSPSACTTTCGDGIKAGEEACDDSNVSSGDCCSSSCELEAGCEIEPNDALAQANDFALLAVGGTLKAFYDPVGESDFFQVVVPAGSIGSLKAETLDGPLGTTCNSNNVDTFVYVRDAAGVSLGSNDDKVTNYCSLLTVGGLAPGSYYVEVTESPLGAGVPFDYTLELTMTLAICGDSVVGPGEQCDDGNTTPGDGCSGVCALEPTNEVEPNDGCALANGPYSPPALVSAAINPLGDVDVFAFTLSSYADVVVETFDSEGPGSCANIDTVISLQAPDCSTVIASDDDAGINSCSKIDAAAKHLAPGTYYVRVEEYGNNGLIPGYTTEISLAALCGNGVVEGSEECDGGATCDAACQRVPTCGDGFIDAPETCDDSNVSSGDGCSATCQVEGVELEAEPNNDSTEADARALDPTPTLITADTKIAGSIGVIGDKDVFKMTTAASSVVRFETFDATGIECAGGMTTALRLLAADGATSLVGDTTRGINACSAIVYNVPAGTYYVEVSEAGDNATIASYVLAVDVQSSAGAESEGNDTPGAANPFTAGAETSDIYVVGDHQVSSDVDYYRIDVPSGKSIRAEIIEGGAETCESLGVDSRLTIFDAAATQIADKDDGGRGYCSLIDGTGATPLDVGVHELAAGTYYLRVQASASAFFPEDEMFDYKLVLTVR